MKLSCLHKTLHRYSIKRISGFSCWHYLITYTPNRYGAPTILSSQPPVLVRRTSTLNNAEIYAEKRWKFCVILRISNFRIFLRTCPTDKWAIQNKYWNFDQLSIGYAFRPSLRYRLTRPRRTSGRNPRAFGAPDSHRSSTLLIPAFSLPYTPPFFTKRLHRIWNAPLPYRA